MADSERSPSPWPATIGPYTVVSELGRGGMGTVYRAHDTRLRRDVALKVLPEELRLTPERLARFEHEARVVAALNHPNIAALYGIEDGATGIQALVLELVEGKSLAARLAEGPLGFAEALDIARQIAQALDAAHEKGVIHRDLKPANIVITRTGLVKVLDFGVAKMTDPAETTSAVTVTTLTREGVIVGTPAYMSPEQARGHAVDKRTDLWAFGCVLYEMLTGHRAFPGGTSSDTLAAVLSAEPDWARLPSIVPSTIRTLLKRCLEREPFKRIADVAAIRFALEDVAFSSGEQQTASARVGRSRSLTGLAWLFGGALIAATFAAVWPDQAAAPPPAPVHQRLTDFEGIEEWPAISPNGQFVAFVRHVDGHRQVWLRSLVGPASLTPVTDDADDHQIPRWTPDSSALIYFSASNTAGEEGTLYEIPALGGDRRRITTAVGGGDISHDGQRIAVFQLRNEKVELAIVTRDGTQVRSVSIPDGGQLGAVRWSPTDEWIAYQRSSAAFSERLFVVAATGGPPIAVAGAASIKGLAWLPDGSGLVYGSSQGSTVLYPPVFTLRTVLRDGSGDRPLTSGEASYTYPDVSAAGDIVATRTWAQSNIWKIPTGRNPLRNVEEATRITHLTGLAQAPSVSPDGTALAYLSDSGGHGNIWIAQTDGSGTRQLTVEQDPDVSIGVPVWSSVSNQIAFIVTRNGITGLWLINADGSGRHNIVPDGVGANWSADGRWLYYSVIRDGEQCIERILVPDGAPEQVRCNGALAPAINRDNSTLYFVEYLERVNGVVGTRIFRATPPEGRKELLGSVASARVPVSPRILMGTLSNDNTILAYPLIDGQTSDVWGLPTSGGPMRRMTDYGNRSVIIARRVAWSPKDDFIYAAVADVDADVVMIKRLLPDSSRLNPDGRSILR